MATDGHPYNCDGKYWNAEVFVGAALRGRPMIHLKARFDQSIVELAVFLSKLRVRCILRAQAF